MSDIKKIFKRKYVLASRSARRANLLAQVGLNYLQVDSMVDEIDYDKNPVNVIKYNSLTKSRKVALDFKKEIVIGADTIVVLGKEIFNKPSGAKQAADYLRRLSGKKHFVYTGINIIDTKTGKEKFDYEKTTVHFRKLGTDEINYYVKNHKPFDKAGAYGIQDDFGCLFVEKMEGDFYNIVGLPLARLFENLKSIL
jgi:septum formation protein